MPNPNRPIDDARAVLAEFLENAESIAYAGHNGHGADDRAGYAATAQVYATLALGIRMAELNSTLGDIASHLDGMAKSLREINDSTDLIQRKTR